jgi:hypothetical protein
MAEPSVPQGLKNQAEIAILPYVLYNCVIPAKIQEYEEKLR